MPQIQTRRDPKSLAPSELAEAIKYHEQARADVPYWKDLELKFSLLKRRNDPDVLKDLDEAVATGSSLVKDHPESRECRSILASALTGRGIVLKRAGQTCEGRGRLPQGSRPPQARPARARGHRATSASFITTSRGSGTNWGTPTRRWPIWKTRSASTNGTGTTDDNGIPWLWYDLDLKYTLLTNRKSKRDYLAEAETAERLPALRPNDPYSAIRAARSLAACTYEGVYGGKPDDPAVKAKVQEYSDRTLKVLQSAAERGLIKAKELNEAVYKKVSSRPEFVKIREILERKP